MVAALLSGCGATRPVLYPNAKWHAVGPAVADRDVRQCLHRADRFLRSRAPEERLARETAGGAAVGAAVGAAAGAVHGEAGRGAAAGAAAGGVAGFLRGLFRIRRPSPLYRRFVERCLREKGYEPIGWR